MAVKVNNLIDFNSDYTKNITGSTFHYPDTSTDADLNELGTTGVVAQVAVGGDGHSAVAAEAAFQAY